MKKIVGPDKTDVKVLKDAPQEITPRDEENFFSVVDTQLDNDTAERIETPEAVYPRQKNVLAIHWHPEFIPIEIALKRMHCMFPRAREELIIPTQHNEILNHRELSGAEVDCYAKGFNQKVQLLIHFKTENLSKSNILKSMIDHTFRYRSSQLFEFIDAIVAPNRNYVDAAALETGADPELINFVRLQVEKVKALLDKHAGKIPTIMIKNKILRNFLDTLRPEYGDSAINRARTYLRAVKKIVKANFSLKFFYSAREIIEEARSVGASIVIPHPEQFWPILLADFDVDGYEVWNPQSRRYTEFLISVVNRTNEQRGPSSRRLLVFMGDDTHMGEKAKSPETQDPLKVRREVGYQPAWEELNIKKKLILTNMEKETVLKEYRERLLA